MPYQKINATKVNSDKTDEKKYKKVKRVLEQEKVKRDRIKEFGIKYDYPGYTALVETALQEVGEAGSD